MGSHAWKARGRVAFNNGLTKCLYPNHFSVFLSSLPSFLNWLPPEAGIRMAAAAVLEMAFTLDNGQEKKLISLSDLFLGVRRKPFHNFLLPSH